MAKGRHFLREWRKHKGYTLEHVAERIGMTHQNLGKVERGKVPYNQTLLELLAETYGTDEASLLIRDPSQPDAIWSIWDQASPGERTQIVRLAQAIKGTGTDG